MAVETLPPVSKARLPVPARAGPEAGFASVGSELDAIFAAAPCAVEPARKLRRPTPVQSYVGAGGRRRPRRRALAALIAVAAAAALGVGAGLLVARFDHAAAPHPGPALASAAAIPAPPAIALPPPPTAFDAEAAAPAHRAWAPSPAEHRRVAQRAAGPARHARPPSRGPGYRAVLAADERLRAAYARAVRAGAPRAVLLRYRDEWADARRQHGRPARLIASYARLERGLDLAAGARRGHRARR